MSGAILRDPTLGMAADVLDGIENVRIGNENRLRQQTRVGLDADGKNRGFGLTTEHPSVIQLSELVAALNCRSTVVGKLWPDRKLTRKLRGEMCCLEHDAEASLERQLRAHPLGPWCKAAHGIGNKQGARLLSAVGDPYWNDLYARPRLVSELWSYCGYGDAEAQVLHRGQKINWSPDARMRAYLISVSIVKAGGPYREVYDAARTKYLEATHKIECRRCGPSGKPALPGSPLSDGHKHARGLRAISKEILRDLWIESKRLHETMEDEV